MAFRKASWPSLFRLTRLATPCPPPGYSLMLSQLSDHRFWATHRDAAGGRLERKQAITHWSSSSSIIPISRSGSRMLFSILTLSCRHLVCVRCRGLSLSQARVDPRQSQEPPRSRAGPAIGPLSDGDNGRHRRRGGRLFAGSLSGLRRRPRDNGVKPRRSRRAIHCPELYLGHDPEAYRLRTWTHDYMGNHEEADRDRRFTRCPMA